MSKLNRTRVSLCSTLALATALLAGASPAAAQALLGTVTSSSGVGTITSDGPLTNIPVTGQQAIINWSATGPSSGGVTTFSNPGSTANFSGTSNFAILNRVAPTVTGNSIFMGGDINSSVNGQVGGTVYFYSPNGIVIGGGASINVGSLGLTTLPIADNQGVWMPGFGGAAPQVVFGTATNAASFVRTETSNDGSINANGPGNYVALVAPRVEHRGTIRTDSGAALVAAGAATITFTPSGLYDIAVTTGSTDPNGVVVDGGRIERNSATLSHHRAYLVSVPANTAMTMLVQGGAQLGFEIAGSVGVEGNVVVLSAGRDVINGSAIGAPSAPASATIDNATIGSSLVMNATQAARISGTGGATALALDGSIAAPVIDVIAENFGLTLGAVLVANADRSGGNATGGTITIAARNGQTLSAANSILASADGSGGSAADDGVNAGNGTGGSISFLASGGGTLSVAGGIDARARGFGGLHGFTNGAAGSGTGGTIAVDAGGGNSAISVAAFAALDASGTGGTTIECLGCSITGGNGTGGTINVGGGLRTAGSGANRLDFTGGLLMVADGDGGAGDAAAGAGRGGFLRLVSSDGTIVTSQSTFAMTADGFGGSYLGSGGGVGGNGTGGEAQIGAYDSAGGSFTLSGGDGEMVLSASGIGGNANQVSSTGGIGQGGRLALDAMGAAITFNGDVFMAADGEGGSALAGTGGRGVGGNVFAHAYGANLILNGNLNQFTTAFGGDGIVGGAGQGGAIVTLAELGSSLTISGEAALDSSALGGTGGFASGGNGGAAIGGDAFLSTATNGSLSVGSVFLTSFGFGGGGFAGGAARGGHAIVASNAGNVDIAGDVLAFVTANGGTGDGGNGGAATGGELDLTADNGTLDIGGATTLVTSGLGGGTFGHTASGGTGTGGALRVQARKGGTMTLLSTLFASSDGQGGDATATAARAGDGFGGTATVGTGIGNATLDARSSVTVIADGNGGFAVCGECLTGGAGGNGTGGQAFVGTGEGAGNRVLIADSLGISANGRGSDGYGGAGGFGRGGTATLFLANDARVAVGSALVIAARGDGGYQSNGGQAGAGFGGTAEVFLAAGAGGLLTVGTNQGAEIDRTTLIDSSGYGGSAGQVVQGIGGGGTGGLSRIFGSGGGASFGGDVVIEADGEGGDGINGNGGAGVGGRSRVNSDGAAFTFDASLLLQSRSVGGSGVNGGNAIAFVGDNAPETATTDARIVARNGTINVSGVTSLDVTAVGGSSTGVGNGGNASAGYATVHSRNSDLGPATITLGDLVLVAAAQGGDGGAGAFADAGGAGGAGGSATGGFIAPTASAGNGHLIIGATTINGIASGGAGGNGGGGEIGAGGNGGDGGAATGAFLYIGTESADNVALGINDGSAEFASITAVLDAIGGAGGDSGSGTTNGVGGTGGTALGGNGHVGVRGSLLEAGDIVVTANATGGKGGLNPTEAPSGAGGNATAGGLVLSVFNRAGNEAMRGELDIGALHMSATGIGGTGASEGLGYAGGRNFFGVTNSDARLASFAMLNAGSTGGDPAAQLDPFILGNASVAVAGDFTVVNPTIVSLWSDGGNLSAANFSINAGNFIRDFTSPATINPVTISAATITLSSGQDIVVDAHLSSASGLTLTAARNIATGNLAASGGLLLDAAGAVATGTIAAQWADLFAAGDLATGDATTSEWFDAEAGGSLSVGNVTASEGIDLGAQGALAAGNLSAGLVNANVREGADYNIGILSATSVAVGNASARDWIGIGTPGTIGTGALRSGNDVLLLADGAITTGAIATGAPNRLLIGGGEMIALGGPTETFDRGQLFAAIGTPAQAATRGAVTVGGAISTARMDALVGTDFTSEALTAATAANATVGGTMIINRAWTSPSTRIESNDLAIGSGGSIGGGRTDLVSRNAAQLLVGDGLSGSGYAIDNAEFGRLSAGTINILGRSDAAAIDTLVGALSLSGRSGGSSVTIASASSAGQPGGSLRVVGAVSGTGFGGNDALTLAAGRVEVDATTGSIALNGGDAQLDGVLNIVGQRVHVAEAAILDRLAADPAYAARDADLARAPATERPGGVVRAANISVELVNGGLPGSGAALYSVLVQNVAAGDTPEGFSAASAEIVSPEGAAAGSIDLNIHSRLVRPGGTLTGVAVRDALMDGDDPARFTATSKINGCALVGPCGQVVRPLPLGRRLDPQPAISTEISLLAASAADDVLFGNEEMIEDNEEDGGDDSASSPIEPPTPLFNTKPLEQESDTDEPVSGGGNPALIGSGPVEGEE